MQYIDRTRQVRSALLQRTDLLNEIRAIFASHVAEDGAKETIGRGNARWVYEVGDLEITPNANIKLLLKLSAKRRYNMSYADASRRSEFGNLTELGAFEVYYDFVAGILPNVSFRSAAAYKRYLKRQYGGDVSESFSLAEHWGGTEVKVGDLGALPYFHMVVKHKEYFGILTEGEPPLIAPQGSANDYNTYDDYTVENGRIIDLGPTQCLLIRVDKGGFSVGFNERHPHCLGLMDRAAKYFDKKNRLEV